MRTAALVIDWQRPVESIEALNSLASMNPPPDILICVENGCTDEGMAKVGGAAPPGTTLIELPDNVGFAAAVNVGMENALLAGAEWVLLLNNDAVVTGRCLERCLEEALAYPRVAAVGPAIAFADRPDRLWYGGGEVSDWFAFTRHRGLLGLASAPPPSGETAFVTGCCMLISAESWRSVGPFRADFFAYYEDAEWCQRARAERWQCRYVGEVLCVHAVSVSSSQGGSLGLSEITAYYLARNPIRFAVETKRWDRRITRTMGLMVVWNTYNALRLIRGRSLRVAAAYTTGVLDALRGRMGPRGRLAHPSSGGPPA